MAYETVKCFVEKHIHCSLKPELNFEIEEADARLIPHTKSAVLGGRAKIVISSTGTVLMLLVHFFKPFSDQAIGV